MGYDVQTACDGPAGVARATGEAWHAVILDVMLPGWTVSKSSSASRKESDVPVLTPTSRGDEMDRIVGLEVGADDYLPKTFSMRELLARLRAVTRRSVARPAADSGDQPEVVVGSLRVNPNTRVALVDNHPVALTPVEFEFLLCLAKAKGRVKSREQLLDEIRDREWEVFDRSVDVHIAALRKKLGDDAKEPKFIRDDAERRLHVDRPRKALRGHGFTIPLQITVAVFASNSQSSGPTLAIPVTRFHFPIPAKLLAGFIANVALLAIGFLWVFNAQFGSATNDLFTGIAEPRVQVVAQAIGEDLRGRGWAEWEQILAEKSRETGVEFSLFDGTLRPGCGSSSGVA